MQITNTSTGKSDDAASVIGEAGIPLFKNFRFTNMRVTDVPMLVDATRIDPRKLMAFGIVLLVWSIWDMTAWTPDVAQWRIMATITLQGAGLGFLFIPLQVLAFATLPGQYRTDGASLFSLFRNIGAAIGVSVTSSMLVHNTQVLHQEIGGAVTPFNRALTGGGPVEHFWDPATRHGAALLDAVINQQALITAYVDDYKMMIFTTAPMLLLLLLMRRSRPVAGKAEHLEPLD